MDESEIYALLKRFKKSQFHDLFSRLGIDDEHIDRRHTTIKLAAAVISFAKQRDGELSKLEVAIRAIHGLPAARAERPGRSSRLDAPANLRDPRSLLLVLTTGRTDLAEGDLRRESAQIRRALGKSDGGGRYRVSVLSAVRREGLLRRLLAHRVAIVHLRGEAAPDASLWLGDELGRVDIVDPAAVARWFKSLPKGACPECIFVNAHQSRELATALARAVKWVVWISREIDALSATAFSTGFYRGLARRKGDYASAFRLRCAEIDLLGMDPTIVPRLFVHGEERWPVSLPGTVDKALATGKARRGDPAPDQEKDTPSEDQPHTCTLWFGTNRRPRDPSNVRAGFGNVDDGRLHYGRCEVLIPKTHNIGSIGSPWWARLWRGDDRIRLEKIDILTEGAFWGQVRSALATLRQEDWTAVVFLHGFRVSFEGAAVRAAQIGFDLKVPGIMAFYSWPSLGTVPGYVADVETVEASAPFLAEFLERLSRHSGAQRIHLMAHSMGNRGLLEALKNLFGGSTTTRATMFDQLVLAAADVDARHFERYAGLYKKAARRTTLYASRNDWALASAGLIRARYRRAGLIPPLTVLPDIDTIDVSPVDLSLLGHGYIFEARAVLTDMHDLVLNDLPPDRRPALRRVERPLHWRILR